MFSIIAFNASAASSEMPGDPYIQDALQFLQAETTVVTVSRVAENIRKAGGSVTVISRKEIANMGARDLADVLRTVPGIGISQNVVGGTQIESRGITTLLSEKVLLMMDGHVINSNLLNGGALGYFDLVMDNIDRIEVVRGPSSALYGTDALVAAINIVTLKAGDMRGSSISVTLGEYDTRQLNLQSGYVGDDLELAFNLNYFDTNGLDAYIKQDAQGHSGTLEFPEEKLDFHIDSSYQNISLKAHYTDSERGGFMNFADTLNTNSTQNYSTYFLDLAYNLHWNNDLSITPRIYYDFFNFDNFFDNFQRRFTSDSIKTGIELQSHYVGIENHTLISGAQYEDQQHDNVKTYAGNPQDGFTDISDTANFNRNTRRNLYALYVEDLWDISPELRLSLGGRYDHYSDFGGNFSPRASLSWLFGNNYDLKLLYGEAFRAPSFAEQFNANQDAILGNINLQPELINTIELGFGAKIQDYGTLRLTLFRNQLENIINAAPGEPPTNSQEHLVTGLEVEGRFHFESGISIRANYTYQDAEDHNTREALPDVPAHKGNIVLDYRLSDNYNFNTHVFFKGKTERSSGSSLPANDSYTVVNVTLLSHKLIPGVKGLEGRLSIYNLFDLDYDDPSSIGLVDYPQPERTVHAQLTYRFD
jgi:iron complex outermembrane receptor protein